MRNGLGVKMESVEIIRDDHSTSRSMNIAAWMPLNGAAACDENYYGTYSAGCSVAGDIFRTRSIAQLSMGFASNFVKKNFSMNTFVKYQKSLEEDKKVYPVLSLQAQTVLANYGVILAGKLNVWDENDVAKATISVTKPINEDSCMKLKITNTLDADIALTTQLSS